MKKILLITIGTISLILGVVGIFLPVVPTTPFLLLTLATYMRSSKKMYDFVLTNKYLKPFVKDYVTGNGIPIKAKIKAIILLWVTSGISLIFVIENIYLRLSLIIIATAVSIFIWTRKSSNE